MMVQNRSRTTCQNHLKRSLARKTRRNQTTTKKCFILLLKVLHLEWLMNLLETIPYNMGSRILVSLTAF